jgi:hypothetical protein
MRLGEIGDDFTVTAARFVADVDTVAATSTYSWNSARRASQQRCRWRTSGRLVMARSS